MAYRHTFLWTLQDDADGDWVVEKMSEVTKRIPNLIAWSIGKHAGAPHPPSRTAYQYATTADVERLEDLGAYLEDPELAATMAEVQSKFQDVAWVDFKLS